MTHSRGPGKGRVAVDGTEAQATFPGLHLAGMQGRHCANAAIANFGSAGGARPAAADAAEPGAIRLPRFVFRWPVGDEARDAA
jgi:hypothetical protein